MLKSDLEASSIEIKELKKDLIFPLAIRFLYLLVKFLGLLRVSFCMLPKRTLS
jgi:hypothetical protein